MNFDVLSRMGVSLERFVRRTFTIPRNIRWVAGLPFEVTLWAILFNDHAREWSRGKSAAWIYGAWLVLIFIPEIQWDLSTIHAGGFINYPGGFTRNIYLTSHCGNTS